MNSLLPLQIAFLLPLLFFPHLPISHSVISVQQSFIQCLRATYFPEDLIFTPANSNYTSLLLSTARNHRILTDSPKPFLIISPAKESHVQSAVSCSRDINIPLRIRSGGHDYEGLSYASTTTPFFIIIDLRKLSSITIDTLVSTAWVQAGATLGELYYAIAMKSRVIGFPAGTCPTVGVGGHFSGGGIGNLVRSHGLSIDNIIDARIVNANGKVLDRESMGEDLFWALRGGGGASFGVILSYKIKLVQVPLKVTVFTISKTLSTVDAAKLSNKYQQIAHGLDERIYLNEVLQLDNHTVNLSFSSLFLGEREELVSLMEQAFPELMLKKNNCQEMSWIESVLYFANYNYSSHLSVLLNNMPWVNNVSFKGKSDILTMPISERGWEEIFEWIRKENQSPLLIFDPLGGRVGEIPASETPFPHRKGSLYGLQYLYEIDQGVEGIEKHLEWMRRFYGFMAPYVSRNPRGAYLNYRDLDLGVNVERNTSFAKACVWGEKYFKGNFRRLVKVKTEVDPDNLFRNEQSIPLLN